MDNNSIEHFRNLLLKQKEDIEKTMERMEDNGTAEQHQTTPVELSNYDNHPADLGTEVFMITMNNALKVHEEHLHKEGIWNAGGLPLLEEPLRHNRYPPGRYIYPESAAENSVPVRE